MLAVLPFERCGTVVVKQVICDMAITNKK